MGLWDTIKGWFNIGGVQVLLWKYSEPLSKANPVIDGAALIKSKSGKRVLSLEIKFVEEYTHQVGEGDDKRSKTDTTVLGLLKFPDHDPGIGYPLDLKPGDQQEQLFTLHVALTDRLQNAGGVLGGIGKVAGWMTSEKLEYYLIAEASVQGAAFNTWDKKKIDIVA